MNFPLITIALLLAAISGIQAVYWPDNFHNQHHTPEYHMPMEVMKDLEFKIKKAVEWHMNHWQSIKGYFKNSISQSGLGCKKTVEEKAYKSAMDDMRKFEEDRTKNNLNCGSISVRFDKKARSELEERQNACANSYTDISLNPDLNEKIENLQRMKDKLLSKLDSSASECQQLHGAQDHELRTCLAEKIRESDQDYSQLDSYAGYLDGEVSRESSKAQVQASNCYKKLASSLDQLRLYEIFDDCSGNPRLPNPTTPAPPTNGPVTPRLSLITPRLSSSTTQTPEEDYEYGATEEPLDGEEFSEDTY